MVFEHDYNAFPELSNSQLEVLQFSSPHKQITSDFSGTVVKVHDGDTVTLQTAFRDFDFPLRLANIDAPEMNNGGDVARDWLKAKIENKDVQVLINFDNRVGKYGRLIGDILINGMSVGTEMQYLGLVSEFGKKLESMVPNVHQWTNSKQWFS